MLNTQHQGKWLSYLDELFKLFYFWIFAVFILFLFRVTLIFTFFEKVGNDTTFDDYLNVFMMGFKFDTHAVMLFLIVPILANTFIHTQNREKIVSKIRLFFSYLYLFVALLFSVITLSYFKEYDNQFNHFIFMGLYDDKEAVFHTIMQQYHPIRSLIVFLILFIIATVITKYLNSIKTNLSWFKKHQTVGTKIVLSALTLFLIVVATRGSFGHRPAIRKWADVSKDTFLNKTIINPIRSLGYAYKDYKKLQVNDGVNPYKIMNNIALTQVTTGDGIGLPNHIILVVMESYDSWPLQEKYKGLHVSDNLGEIAKRGIHFKNFLPTASSTFNSLGAIISGLPYTGVNISLKKAFNGEEETSIFKQIKELGYDTFFFYGGFSSWQNLGNFVKNQGANHVYTAANIGGKTESGVWGADDNQLFEMVTDKLRTHKKTFSVIMTTSYHGPFTIDVKKYGYPYRTVKDYPKKYQELDDGSMEPNTLGHLWFSDYALGNFVRDFESKEPDTLFAFTGDHFGRRYFHGKPNLYELSSVPFILYGKGLKGININTNRVGSHMDIFPTILELISQKKYRYKSFGLPMQHKKEDSIAVGYNKMAYKKEIIEKNPNGTFHIWDGEKDTLIKKSEEMSTINNYYNNYMGNAWEKTISKGK